MTESDEYTPTNRERAKSAKKMNRTIYCMTCDGGLVGEWGRCPRCNRKHNPKKIKIEAHIND